MPSVSDVILGIAQCARESADGHGVVDASEFARRLVMLAMACDPDPAKRVVPWVEPRPERARHVDPAFSQGHSNVGPQFLVTPKTTHKPGGE
ncbi:MAG: hypothetical protein EHM42_09825 [Planctomycetaceae bacterium]|nr:MAG: hypothetical protein EHM42_10890 [Planctomycetaceae bacterium]RPI82134.1 MAG: hypothetical protein EHM42_09825 [Planctomycetaceae bacterium]